jgi:dTDP-4-dehydrorhamnose reductase
MVYDELGRNFVNTLLRIAPERPALTVVADQFGNPTYAGDLAEALWRLVDIPAYGLYHLTNEGIASWYDWAVEIMRRGKLSTKVEPIPGREYRRDARPPANGALANRAAAGLGIRLADWRDGLYRCLQRRATLDQE